MRRLSLTVTLLFMIVSSFAQSKDVLRFSLVGGVTSSNFRAWKSPYPPYDFTPHSIRNSTVGIQVRWRFYKSLWFVTGASQMTMGTDIDYVDVQFEGDLVTDISYQDHRENKYTVLPLLLEYRVSKKFEYYINGGAYFGWLKHSYHSVFERNIKVAGNDIVHLEYNTGYSYDPWRTRDLDAGIILGCGVAYPLSKRFIAEASPSFLIGLRPLDAVNNDEIIYKDLIVPVGVEDYGGLSSKSKNQVFTLSVALTYKFL